MRRRGYRAGRPVRRLPAGSAMVVGLMAALAASTPAHGQTLRWKAEAGLENRVFPGTPAASWQSSATLSPSFVLRPEMSYESGSGSWELVAEGFLRLDAHDSNRTHLDFRELGVTVFADWGTVFAGVGRVFWGVTELRHLVDVVNQTDAVEDLDGEDKLGQPMVSVTVDADWGTLDLFALPVSRERTWPAADARLSGALPVSGDAVWESGLGRWYPGVAARWSRTVGAVDLGVSGFHGTSREPRFQLDTRPGTSPTLVPVYDVITQLGLDAQWTGDATLLKLESIARTGHGDGLAAISAGVEHTLYGVFGTNADLGLVGEIMFDSRDDAAPPTVFDNDVFIGARWAFNDPGSTAVLGGPVVDTKSGEMLWVLEAERRVGNAWKVGLDVRAFANTRPGSVPHSVRKDSHVTVSLRRFF